MRRILMLIIRGYQLLLSPLFPPSCRFLPTCSEYARESLEIHGTFKGLSLTVWRLLRCHPLCKGGFDPVPGISAGRSNVDSQTAPSVDPRHDLPDARAGSDTIGHGQVKGQA